VSRFQHIVVNFCSAPSGSGKTHQIVTRACDLARQGERVLVVQPTKDLIDKTVREELGSRCAPPPHRIFHGGTVREGQSVAHELTEYVRAGPCDGEIIFTTHQVLPYVRYWANKGDFHLLIDEELEVLRYRAHRLPQTHRLITDHLQIIPHNSIYERVRLARPHTLEKIGKNQEKDEILERVSDTVRTLTSLHWETCVNAEQYTKLVSGGGQRLAFHSVLKPSVVLGFKSVFMAAANFTDTPVYRLWEDMGVRFREDREFARSLRFSTHTNGDLITILYVMEEQWSKKRMKATSGSELTTTLDRMIQAVKSHFGDGHFLWQANKSFQEDPFGNNAVRLSNKPHGLNTYADVHDIAFISALNPTTEHFRFLEHRGLSGGDVRRFTYLASVYQSVMRSSIRNPDNRDPKRILVPDRGAADYLRELFPGSKIERLEIGLPEALNKKPGRPRIHLSGRQRTAAFRRMRQEKKRKMLQDLLGLCRGQDASRGGLCNENPIDPITDSVTRLTVGTLYSGTRSTKPAGFLNCQDVEDFVTCLKTFHERTFTGKQDNLLISPAVFDPDKVVGTSRGTGNIDHVRHIWLDFEDGQLRPDEIADLFPNIRLMMMNTFNHTAEKPRFRVVIPTAQPVTAEAHVHLIEQIAAKLKDAGYRVEGRRNYRRRKNSRPSGLDWSKSSPASLFYLPSQAQDPRQSFFRDYAGGDRTIMDPLVWVEHGVALLQPETEIEPAIERSGWIDYAKIDHAIKNWRISKRLPGQGNRMFFDLALALERARMNHDDIEATLKVEAAFGRSPQERRDQIESIMNTLRLRCRQKTDS